MRLLICDVTQGFRREASRGADSGATRSAAANNAEDSVATAKSKRARVTTRPPTAASSTTKKPIFKFLRTRGRDLERGRELKRWTEGSGAKDEETGVEMFCWKRVDEREEERRGEL
ncbi:hypothetical protein TKK_0004156 [Trichogramma kaykai]